MEWGFSLRVDDDTELRLLTMADADALFALTEENRADLRAWLNWVDSNTRLEDTRAFINRALRDHQQGDGLHTGIWADGTLVGVIDLFKIDRANASAEVGYWLSPPHRGRGLMTRCCAALVDHALRAMGLNRVEIRVVVGNGRSEAIPNRLGLTLEGTLREAYWLYDGFKDVRVYGMLAREWSRPVEPQTGRGQGGVRGDGAQ